METINSHTDTVSLTISKSYSLPNLHSSKPTLFQSYSLPIIHSSNHALFHSYILPIMHSSNLTLFQSYTLLQSYTLPILHPSNATLFQLYNLPIIQSVSKKMSFCGKTKNGNNYLQTHPKCKSWGCFGKFMIFATTWALRFSKLKEK